MILAHGFVLWAVVLSGFYFLLPVLAFCIFYYVRCWLKRQGQQLTLLQDDFCWLESPLHSRQHYQLGKRHFICEFLVVVELRRDHRRFATAHYLPVFSDAVDADTFRRLRVALSLNQRAKPASSVVSE